MSRNGRRPVQRPRNTSAKAITVPLLALTLAAGGATAQASVNLVTDGTFTQNSLTCTGTCSTPTSFQLGSWSNGGGNYVGTATGWTTALFGGGASYNFLYSSYNAAALGVDGNVSLSATSNIPTGGNFLASDPIYEAGSISQTVSGLNTYNPVTLTFSWAVAQQTTFTGSVTGDWQVSLCPTSGCTGSDTQNTTSISIPQQGFSNWMTATMTFVPASTSEVLTFLAVGSGAPVFLLFGGVSASQIPEPASWAITLAGLFGLGMVSRWRRRSTPPGAAA